MKTLLFLLCASRLAAGTVEVEWDANPAADNVTAYVLNERMPDGTVRKVAEVDGRTTFASGSFEAGKHTVFVVAKSGGIQSDPSAPLTFTVPAKPAGVRTRVTSQPASITK